MDEGDGCARLARFPGGLAGDDARGIVAKMGFSEMRTRELSVAIPPGRLRQNVEAQTGSLETPEYPMEARLAFGGGSRAWEGVSD